MSTTAQPREDARHQLARLLEDGCDPEEAARAVIADLDRDELEEVALPLLAWRARRIRRARSRRAERAAFDSAGRANEGSGPIGRTPVQQTNTERLRLLFGTGFELPDGRWVTWDTATREEHLERAAWLRKHARATEVTASRHEHIAKRLKAAKVATLAELLAREAA
jgi:hypothetical protein